MITVESIDHIVFNVHDADVSVAWNERVPGMTRKVAAPESGSAPRTSVVFGFHKINLRPKSASQADCFTGTQPAPGTTDLCFLTSASPDEVAAHFGNATLKSYWDRRT